VPSLSTFLRPSIAQLQALCTPLLDSCRAGTLAAADAARLLTGAIVDESDDAEVRALAGRRKLPSILRFLFTSKVSWAVFTVEWLDALGAFLTSLGLAGHDGAARPAVESTSRE
jgi:hypothetical protein